MANEKTCRRDADKGDRDGRAPQGTARRLQYLFNFLGLAEEEVGLAVPAGVEAGIEAGGSVCCRQFKMVLEREWRVGVGGGDFGLVAVVDCVHGNGLPEFGLVDATVAKLDTGEFWRMFHAVQ